MLRDAWVLYVSFPLILATTWYGQLLTIIIITHILCYRWRDLVACIKPLLVHNGTTI